MRRAPARCRCPTVRASLLPCCCPRTWPVRHHVAQCNAKRTFSSHFILNFSQPAVHTTHFTLHTWSHLTSNHLISSHLMSPNLSSSHLIPSLLTCHLRKFFSTVFISSEHWKKFISTHLISSARQKDLTVRAKSFAQKNVKRTRLLHTEAWDTGAFTQKNLDNILCPTKLAQSTSQYYFVLQSLHTVRSSTPFYNKTCTKHFPVLLCTTQLAHSTSQYYFVLQSLHKVRPSTTLYYKACTKYVPVLLCTTKLAQSTSQYYFVLQSLHKVRSSTPFYNKTCTKHFPVLLCCAQLAQSTSHYYFVLHSLHKALPSTTLYYTACTKHLSVLLCYKAYTKYIPGAKIWLSQLWCSHANTIYEVQLQKTIVLRTQPWHRATLTQSLQCDLQTLSCKTQ